MNITLYRFTSTELAILTQRLIGDALTLDESALADLDTSAEQVSIAEEELLERGLLVRAPLEEVVGVSSEVTTLIATTLRPELLCVLRIVRGDDNLPPIYFSFTAEAIAVNYVDSRGQHTFAELTSLNDAVGEMLRVSEALPRADGISPNEALPLETVIHEVQVLALLMVVAAPSAPRPSVHNLSWLVARGRLWLVEGPTEQSTPTARTVDSAALRHEIIAALAPHYPTMMDDLRRIGA